VSFLQDAASELLYPLLPIYLTVVLGAPPSVVGAIEGVAEGAASVTKIAVGPLGDRPVRASPKSALVRLRYAPAAKRTIPPRRTRPLAMPLLPAQHRQGASGRSSCL